MSNLTTDPAFIDRVCPLCGGTQAVPVVASTPPGETADETVLQSSWFGFFKKKLFFTYSRCTGCGMLYSKRYFSDAALARLYQSMPDNGAGLERPGLVSTQQGYFEMLAGRPAPEGDYLELGPDVGIFTRFAAQLMPRAKLWLFEPNAAVHVDLAQAAVGNPSEIRTEMTDFSVVPDGSVGLCSMIHVLDHLPDAAHVLNQLAAKLRPDGLLLVVTHDERSLLARALGARWPAFCLQHPHLFNRRTTRAFMERCGLEVIMTRQSTNYFPAAYLLKHLLYAFGVRFVADWNAKSLVIPLRLGNIVSIARPGKPAQPS